MENYKTTSFLVKMLSKTSLENSSVSSSFNVLANFPLSLLGYLNCVGIRLMTIRSWVRFSQRGFFPYLLGFLLNWCIGIIA
ncbi:hypothetical protein HanLR1_Chr17g0677591 [Helianthus annuus]|nr:hypothetical protein HanHA89_Chr17g0719131 [Helianthus annuus]KAJ0633503.1 hypothetical protein HanLR1_Chr17g0677591 [Helianthus annuus]